MEHPGFLQHGNLCLVDSRSLWVPCPWAIYLLATTYW